MDSTSTRRPMTTAIALTAASLIAFTTPTTGPLAGSSSGPAVPRISIEAVQLTALPAAFQQVWDIATGKDADYPLPTGSNPIAPIAEQVLRTVVTYGTQLITGQGGKIPGEIAAQVEKLQSAVTRIGALLVDAVATVPVVLFSLAFNTALVIGSLPDSAGALPALGTIWLNAALLPPLKWVYNAFAIRNTIALAVQPPQAPQPESTGATVVAPPTSTARRTDSRPVPPRASSRPRASKADAVSSAAPTAAKTASPSPARSAAATGTKRNLKSVGAKSDQHRATARANDSA